MTSIWMWSEVNTSTIGILTLVVFIERYSLHTGGLKVMFHSTIVFVHVHHMYIKGVNHAVHTCVYQSMSLLSSL